MVGVPQLLLLYSTLPLIISGPVLPALQPFENQQA
jgi:hypothetical protein